MEPFAPGTVVGDAYRLVRRLGGGGMGSVHAAEVIADVLPDRGDAAGPIAVGTEVAVKLLADGGGPREEAAARFVREARALSQLRNAHTARLLDARHVDDPATPFLVMELLVGEDLAAVAARQPSIDEAIALVAQACEGLERAHALGIVHRDVKPGNLFVTRDEAGAPLVKVLDFGISKLEDDLALTGASAVLGSTHYMSPEQLLASTDVDARTDVWSLSVVLYEVLTGALPFDGRVATAVCSAILTGEPLPPSARRPEVPPELDAVVLRGLTKDRGARYPSARALADALVTCRRSRSAATD